MAGLNGLGGTRLWCGVLLVPPPPLSLTCQQPSLSHPLEAILAKAGSRLGAKGLTGTRKCKKRTVMIVYTMRAYCRYSADNTVFAGCRARQCILG